MSKIQTPAMVKINKKRKGQKYGQTPLKGAWHRLVRNKMSVVGMVIIVLLLLMAIFANFIAPYSYQQQDYTAIAQGPSPAHIFGTDNMGTRFLGVETDEEWARIKDVLRQLAKKEEA